MWRQITVPSAENKVTMYTLLLMERLHQQLTPYHKAQRISQKLGQKQCKRQRVGEYMCNIVLWACHDCCDHEHIVAVITYARRAQDQAS